MEMPIRFRRMCQLRLLLLIMHDTAFTLLTESFPLDRPLICYRKESKLIFKSLVVPRKYLNVQILISGSQEFCYLMCCEETPTL